MTKKIFGTIVILLLIAGNVTAQGPKVGGACSYKDFPGTCTITGIAIEGRPVFTFVGTVEGKEVKLKGNRMSESQPEPKNTQLKCSLRYITKGTCTPCLFSIGECGAAAWDAFRSSHDPAQNKKL